MSTIPPSFNPHAVHPFTAGTATSRRGQSNTAYIAIPSSQTASQTSSGGANNSQPPLATSVPSQTQARGHAHVYSPEPRSGARYQAQASGQPIFTPFRLERSSPELSDVLAKKGTPVWPGHPSYGTQTSTAGKSGTGKS